MLKYLCGDVGTKASEQGMLYFDYGDKDGIQGFLLQFPLPLHNYSFTDLLAVALGDVMQNEFLSC